MKLLPARMTISIGLRNNSVMEQQNLSTNIQNVTGIQNEEMSTGIKHVAKLVSIII